MIKIAKETQKAFLEMSSKRETMSTKTMKMSSGTISKITTFPT